jgi:photosystem II stability/assembly factor-like uncharacterized protein
MKRRRSHSSRESETMQKAAHGRVSRLLPLLILIGVSLPASAVQAGVNVWTTNGPAGAIIRELAIDPANPATLYAGTYGGGVFKSSNSGGTWSTVNTGLTTLYVLALAIDPSAPATLYAGTHSGGLFKSTNGGESWSAINTGLTTPHVTALAIDPSAPATLYAGTFDRGVFKSTDSGGRWAAINNGLATPYIDSLAVNPAAPGTLYAGAFGPQVFKSSDSGGTWARTGAGPNDPWGYGSAYALAVSPATPATVYAATDYGLFKSTDGGGSWTAVDTDLISAVVALAIDPANPTTLYAGARGRGVLKSTDAGASWTAMNAGLTNPFVNALAIDPSTPARIYAGTDSGVYEYLASESACVSDSTTLCLSNSRHQVKTEWVTRDGASGAGQAISLTTDTGAFWFFGSSNIEVLVKVLNGCSLNSRYWTFAGGLTDVNVILTVTDTQTGAVQTYTNPLGTPFQPIQDTNAFATCP